MAARFRNFSLLLFPLLALAACAPLPRGGTSKLLPSSGLREQTLTSLGYTALPMRKISRDSRYSGQFRVNGGAVDMLIDSGANSTDLSTGIAPKLNLVIDEKARVVSRGALGRPVTSHVGIGVLTAGPVSALPFPFMVATEDLGSTATSRYDGQIGLDALNALGALVDLRSGQFWVPGDRAKVGRNGRIQPLGFNRKLGFTALSITPAAGLPHLVLESKINGQRLTWIVDTGAEVSVLSAASADSLGLQTRASASRIIDASGDNAPARAALLRNVVFEQLVLSEFQVAVIPLPVVRRNFKDRGGRPIDGIVGMDFLENTAALLDTGSSLIYIGDPATQVN